MIGSTSQAKTTSTQGQGQSGPADHVPTLAPAPEGLSARRVERWLDMPPGAWQRRRLFAVRCTGDLFSYIGVRRQDLLVVEPGGRERPGRMLLVRIDGSLSLRRVPLAPEGRDRMESILELPFGPAERTRGERIVGTVLALLRPTGTGALRPVPLDQHRRRARTAGARPVQRPLRSRAESERLEVTHLEATLARWQKWRRSAGDPAEAVIERCARMERGLTTLLGCLVHAHHPRLRSALFEQATTIATAMRREMGG